MKLNQEELPKKIPHKTKGNYELTPIKLKI